MVLLLPQDPQISVLMSGSHKSPGSLHKERGGGWCSGTMMQLENPEMLVNPIRPEPRGSRFLLLSAAGASVCAFLMEGRLQADVCMREEEKPSALNSY